MTFNVYTKAYHLQIKVKYIYYALLYLFALGT